VSSQGVPVAGGSAAHLRRAGLLASLVLIALSAMAPAAQAGPARFTYELCDSALPGGANPSLQFVVNPGVPISYFNNCAQPGGSIGLNEWGHASATFAYLSVTVPETPGGFVETETISAAAGGLGGGNDHTFVYEQAWPQNNEGEKTRTFFVRRERQPFFGNGGSFLLFMNCNGNWGPGCEAGPTIWAHYISTTQVDPVAPKLAPLEGSLLAKETLRGRQSLSTSATDEGGGLSKISITVNGLPAGQPTVANCNLAQVNNPSYRGTVAVSLTPCPASLKSGWNLDTQAYPFHDGANAVQICASDFSTLNEPNTTCSPVQTVSVDNSCTNSAVAGGELLSAQFAGSNADTRTVGYGKGAEVIGRLATNSGDPVSGATLCVKLQTIGVEPRARTVATVKTDANGQYAYQLPPGPNRNVVIGYRHDSAQVARDVRFYAHAQPSLHVSPPKLENGQSVRFWGLLPGPSSAGRVVVLQANVVGSKRWITFRKATTGERGGFHGKYRFTSTTRTTKYRFRAVSPLQAGYPWVQGHSKPVKVLVSR
jgi:hypothetical protein